MRRDSGFTLLELLVAFVAFLALILTLVMVTTVTLEAWNLGEQRKDQFDRSTALLSIVEDDLGNLFAERQAPWIGTPDQKVYLPAAHLFAEPDGRGRTVLRFVRVGDRDQMMARPEPPLSRPYPPDMYQELYEVAYAMDDVQPILYRGTRFFRRDDKGSLLAAGRLDKSALRPLASGVLFLEFRFWAQDSSEWETAANIWDSSRWRLRNFRFRQTARNYDQPDFVYPRAVQATVVLAPEAFTERKVVLAEEIGAAKSVAVRLNTTRELPEPPAMVKIEDEWLEYTAKDMNGILVSRRGLRLSSASSHAQGSAVLFGETIVRTIPLSVSQEAVGP